MLIQVPKYVSILLYYYLNNYQIDLLILLKCENSISFKYVDLDGVLSGEILRVKSMSEFPGVEFVPWFIRPSSTHFQGNILCACENEVY